jgi:hypothetical protein
MTTVTFSVASSSSSSSGSNNIYFPSSIPTKEHAKVFAPPNSSFEGHPSTMIPRLRSGLNWIGGNSNRESAEVKDNQAESRALPS